MRSFEYLSPTAKEQAIGLLGNNWDSEVLAGGTDLLALMKDDVVTPKRLVNIKHVTGMDPITHTSKGLRIGALAKLQDIADNADVQRHFSTLAVVVDEAASPQIRHMATMGGNLCQRPRCWYFRNGYGLLATKDGKSLVTDGDNRYHAILGNDGPAKFVSPSTIAPMLIALGAKVRLQGPNGPRELDLEKFYVVPQNDGEREHDLKPNEIVTEIFVPTMAAATRTGYYEVRQKAAFDWPLATASVVLQMDGNVVKSARVVMGHVAPKPWVSQEAADALVGKPLSESTADAAGKAAVGGARPLSRNAYKVQLARVAVKRALMNTAGHSLMSSDVTKGGA